MSIDVAKMEYALKTADTGKSPAKEPIKFYEKEYYMFSNFSSFSVRYDKRDWMTSEHAYQAMKFNDLWYQEWIRSQKSAYDAKKAARSKSMMVRGDWNEVKLLFMLEICRDKLNQHKIIQQKLLKTGDREIIEDSPEDSFWGWGRNKNGENHLGRIWMILRDELRVKAQMRNNYIVNNLKNE